MALDLERLGLGDRSRVADLLRACRGHVLGEAVLEATFERRLRSRPDGLSVSAAGRASP